MFRGTGLRNDPPPPRLRRGERITKEYVLRSRSRSQSPQPHAESGGNHQRDPAYAHWDRQRSDGDLGLID